MKKSITTYRVIKKENRPKSSHKESVIIHIAYTSHLSSSEQKIKMIFFLILAAKIQCAEKPRLYNLQSHRSVIKHFGLLHLLTTNIIFF